MFSSCLPTLVTLIFFIVVINQFSTYSNYTSLQIFNDMSLKYNQAIEQVDSSIIYKETNQEGVNVYYLNETNVFNSDYFKDYREYIIQENMPYDYSESKNRNSLKFKKGGFLHVQLCSQANPR